jgi:hypothetical protein
MVQGGLIAQGIERVEMNYARAIDRGDFDPVVLWLNFRDDLARTIAGQYGQADRVARMVADDRHQT